MSEVRVISVGLQALLVGTGGALGALCRVGTGALMLSLLGKSWTGTLAANLLGCALMGGIKGLIDAHQWGSAEVRTFLLGGFLGAFTTFSTFMSDGASMWREDNITGSLMYVCGSVLAGALCFVFGWWLATRTMGGT